MTDNPYEPPQTQGPTQPEPARPHRWRSLFIFVVVLAGCFLVFPSAGAGLHFQWTLKALLLAFGVSMAAVTFDEKVIQKNQMTTFDDNPYELPTASDTPDDGSVFTRRISLYWLWLAIVVLVALAFIS